MNKINKIKQFFAKELSKDVQSVMLLEVSDGSYLAFGKYSILPKNGCYEIRAIKEPCREHLMISDLKIAVSWCVFDKYQRLSETKRLTEIDTELSGIKITLAALQQKLNKSEKSSDKYIYLAKIQETKYRKAKIIRELNQYIGTSSLWQKEKFRQFDPSYS